MFCNKEDYTDNNVILIIGKIDISIPFKLGVKQGDSVEPILFLFATWIETQIMENWPQRMLKIHPSWDHTWKRFTEPPTG